MVRPLRIRENQAAQLAKISQIPPDILKSVLSELNASPSPVIAVSELREIIRRTLKDKDQSTPLSRQLIGLAIYARVYGETAGGTIASLLEGLKNTDLSKDEVEQLNELGPTLESLLDHISVKASAKALQLGWDHKHVHSKARIVTDIRPVFDDGKDEILGAVIFHILRLEYHDGDQEDNISVAMDKDDVQALRDACDEALKKAESARGLVMEKCKLHAFVFGEEEYGST